MKVKVKCDQKDFNKVNLGIHWRCFGFFITSLVSKIFGKKLRPLFFPKIEPKQDFSDFLNKPLCQF